MKYNLEKLEDGRIKIDVELDKEEVSRFCKEAEKSLANQKKFDEALGRKGGIVNKEKKLEESCLAFAVSNSYLEIVEKESLEPLGTPEIKVKVFLPWLSLKYQIVVAVVPDIKLPDYWKIAEEIFGPEEKIEVAEEEVEEALKWLKDSRSKVEPVDKFSEPGDYIEIEYEIFDEENNKIYDQKDFFELGKGQYFTGFEEKLRGLKSEEKTEFKLKIPEDWGKEEWQGRELKFSVRVNFVGRKISPELNDGFAQSVSGNKFKNLGELKNSIREGLEEEKRNTLREKRRIQFLEKIAQMIGEVSIPDILLETQANFDLDHLKEMLKDLGTTYQDYLKLANKSEEELREDLKAQAKRFVIHSLILRKIAQENKVEATEEEIDAYARKLLSQYPRETVEKINPKDLYELAKERVVFAKSFELLEKKAKESTNKSS